VHSWGDRVGGPDQKAVVRRTVGSGLSPCRRAFSVCLTGEPQGRGAAMRGCADLASPRSFTRPSGPCRGAALEPVRTGDGKLPRANHGSAILLHER
jgi:hypothetical protein